MATAYQNLSEYDFNSVPDGSEVTVGIVVAEWNKHITEKLSLIHISEPTRPEAIAYALLGW